MSDLYGQATTEELEKIDQTARHFGVVRRDKKLVGESILRLGHLMNSQEFSPSDERSHALFRMYRYFKSL